MVSGPWKPRCCPGGVTGDCHLLLLLLVPLQHSWGQGVWDGGLAAGCPLHGPGWVVFVEMWVPAVPAAIKACGELVLGV